MTTIDDYVAESAPAIDEIETYSNLVNAAIVARQAMDTGRWLLGNYVRQLVTYYNEHTLQQFAEEIGVDEKRLYEYGVMASFYPLEVRETLSELDLTYSHYREAKRLGSLDQAVEFLKAIAENRWTVTQTRERVKLMLHPLRVPGYTEGSGVTTTQDKPVNPWHPRPIWEAIMTVTIKNGKVSLNADNISVPPDVESGRSYKIIFVPLDE